MNMSDFVGQILSERTNLTLEEANGVAFYIMNKSNFKGVKIIAALSGIVSSPKQVEKAKSLFLKFKQELSSEELSSQIEGYKDHQREADAQIKRTIRAVEKHEDLLTAALSLSVEDQTNKVVDVDKSEEYDHLFSLREEDVVLVRRNCEKAVAKKIDCDLFWGKVVFIDTDGSLHVDPLGESSCSNIRKGEIVKSHISKVTRLIKKENYEKE